MSQEASVPPTNANKSLGYVALGILIASVIGMLAVSYLGGIAFSLGIISFFVFTAGINLAKNTFTKRNYEQVIVFIWITISTLIIGLIQYYFYFPQAYPGSPCAIDYYLITIENKDTQLHRFRAQEFISFHPEVFKETQFTPESAWVSTSIDGHAGFLLPETELRSSSYGFLLNEVKFESPDVSYSFAFSDLSLPWNYDFSPSCTEAVIRLRDFPLDAFYAALDAFELERHSYVNTETVTWDTYSRDIRFVYIRPPFQLFKPFIKPFLGVSSLNQWIIGLIGLIGTAIMTPVIKPVLIEVLQKRFKKRIDNDQLKTKQTTKIVVSSRGEEKEIEVKKNGRTKQ